MTAMVSLLVMGDRLVIDTHSPVPSYRQLADQLRDRIASGQIGPREPLPSITAMTQETGLAVGTVRKAVGVLVDEGWAYTVPGRGTYAADVQAPGQR
jgi:DNA-binding GntR family transcriptional regulator